MNKERSLRSLTLIAHFHSNFCVRLVCVVWPFANCIAKSWNANEMLKYRWNWKLNSALLTSVNCEQVKSSLIVWRHSSEFASPWRCLQQAFQIRFNFRDRMRHNLWHYVIVWRKSYDRSYIWINNRSFTEQPPFITWLYGPLARENHTFMRVDLLTRQHDMKRINGSVT